MTDFKITPKKDCPLCYGRGYVLMLLEPHLKDDSHRAKVDCNCVIQQRMAIRAKIKANALGGKNVKKAVEKPSNAGTNLGTNSELQQDAPSGDTDKSNADSAV